MNTNEHSSRSVEVLRFRPVRIQFSDVKNEPVNDVLCMKFEVGLGADRSHAYVRLDRAGHVVDVQAANAPPQTTGDADLDDLLGGRAREELARALAVGVVGAFYSGRQRP